VIWDSLPGVPGNLATQGNYEDDPFDAIVASIDLDNWLVNLVAAKAVETRAVDHDVDFYVIYSSYTGFEDHTIDLWAGFYDDDGQTPVGTKWQQVEIYPMGIRFAGNIFDELSYKLEGVYEWGDIDNVTVTEDDGDIRAWAVEAGLKWTPDAEYSPWLGFTYTFFSGDDDDDEDWEAYNRLFEGKTYGEIAETIMYYNSNLGDEGLGNHIFNLAGGLSITEDLRACLSWYYLMTEEDDSESDDDIGHELDAYLDYTFSENLTATLAAGFLDTDDVIENEYGEDDTAYFFRGGISVSF
jgi:hypothetical protein